MAFPFPPLPYQVLQGPDNTIVITGANTGLGFEAAKHCVRLEAAKVILAVRNLTKGDAAKAAIHAAYPVSTTVIEVWHLDLLSTDSVKAFAAQVESLERLDAVIENAGMIAPIWAEVEGFESTILANVISTNLLALLLLPKLQETAIRWNVQPRLSVVVSESHFVARFNERTKSDIFEALGTEVGADMDHRYAVSKLLEVFFVRALAERISKSQKPKIIVNCMTPGACQTDIRRNLTGWKKWSMVLLTAVIARTAEVGSRTLIAGIVAGDESHGEYMADCLVAKPSDLVLSDEGAILQEKIWDEMINKLAVIQPGIENCF